MYPVDTTHTSIEVLRRLAYADRPNYELPQLVSDYWPEKLPIFIKITSGYCGASSIDFTFGTDEMYLITHVNTQDRVVLKNRSGQLFSFPSDYYMKFYTLADGVKDETPKKLSEILEEHSMSACKLELVPVSDESIEFYKGPGQELSMHVDLFEWETSYEERYLVGNSIAFEKLFHTPFVIPIWMPINIDVATGVKDEPPEAFDRLMMTIGRIARQVKNAQAPGNKEVMLFEGKLTDYEDGNYDIIRPSDYATVGSICKLDERTIGPMPVSAPRLPERNPITYDDDEEPPPVPDSKKPNLTQPKSQQITKKKIYPPDHPKHVEEKKTITKKKKHLFGNRDKDKVFSPSGESLGSNHSGETKVSRIAHHIGKIKHLPDVLKKKVKKSSSGSTKEGESPDIDDDADAFYESPDEGTMSPSGESFMSQKSTASARSADMDDIYEDEQFGEDEEEEEEEGEDDIYIRSGELDYEFVPDEMVKKDTSGYSKTKQVCVVQPSNTDDQIYSLCEADEVSESPGGRSLQELPASQNNQNLARPLPNLPTTTSGTEAGDKAKTGTATSTQSEVGQSHSSQDVLKVNRKWPPTSAKPPPTAAKPSPAQRSVSDKGEDATTSNRPPVKKVVSNPNDKGVEKLQQTTPRPPVVAKKPTPVQRSVSNEGDVTTSSKPVDVGGHTLHKSLQKSEWKPTVTRKPSQDTIETKKPDKTDETTSNSGESVYGCFADLPKSLKGLSVSGVLDCLNILKMSHYTAVFKENDIDGDLLQDFDETMMVEDFNFKRFEAKKMMRFINGWRPEGTELKK